LLHYSITYSGTTGVNQLTGANLHKPVVYIDYTGASTTRLPATTSGNNNTVFIFKNINTGTATITRTASGDTVTTINGAVTYDLMPGESILVQYIHASTDWRILWKYDANAPAAIDTFIGLTDTPSTYTAGALPATNGAADALIWSNIYYELIQSGGTADRIVIKASENLFEEEVLVVYPNGQSTNKGFIIQQDTALAGSDHLLIQKVQAITSITGDLNLYGADIVNDRVRVIRFSQDPNVYFLGSDRPFIRTLRPGYYGSSIVNFYGEEETIILTGSAASQGATAVSNSMLSVKNWFSGNYVNPNSGSTHILNLGDVIYYKETDWDGTNTSGVVIVVKGDRHIVDEPQNYIDRESVIVNEIDKQAGMSEFGFYAHKSNGGIFKQPLPTYADNDAAIAGGLTTDMWYKTSTGEVRIVV
jgi:hypothetical protein